MWNGAGSIVERGETLGSNLLALLVAPGIIVHELAHAGACWLAGVEIREIVLFSWPTSFTRELAGPAYVRTAHTESKLATSFISGAPLIVNGISALAVFFATRQLLLSADVSADGQAGLLRYYYQPFLSLDLSVQVLVVGLLWFGLSLALAGFPSRGDIKNISDALDIVPEIVSKFGGLAYLFDHLQNEMEIIYAGILLVVGLFGIDVLFQLGPDLLVYLTVGILLLTLRVAGAESKRLPTSRHGEYVRIRIIRRQVEDKDMPAKADIELLVEKLSDRNQQLRKEVVSALSSVANHNPSALAGVEGEIFTQCETEPDSVVRSKLFRLLSAWYDSADTERVASIATTALENGDTDVLKQNTKLLDQIAADDPHYLNRYRTELGELVPFTRGASRTYLLRVLARTAEPVDESEKQYSQNLPTIDNERDREAVESELLTAVSSELEPVIEDIVSGLDNESPPRQVSVIEDLGYIGEYHSGVAGPAAQLLGYYAEDQVADIRSAVADALNRIAKENPRAVLVERDALERLLADDRQDVRIPAARAMKEMTTVQPSQPDAIVDILESGLEDDNTTVRSQSVLALARLAETSPAAVSAETTRLIESIEDPDEGVRTNAILALWKIAGEVPETLASELDRLQNRLNDPNDSVRSNTLGTLKALASEDPDAVVTVADSIRSRLETDDYLSARINAASCLSTLARTHPESTVPAVETLLGFGNEDDHELRKNAIEALANLAEQQPEFVVANTDRFAMKLDEENVDVRAGAARTLAAIGETYPDSVALHTDSLVCALDDTSSAVREPALSALTATLDLEDEIARTDSC